MNLRKHVATLLVAWLVLAPATAMAKRRPGSARPETPPATARPGSPPRPEFHAVGAEHLVRGRDGFEISAAPGHWHADGERAGGGLLKATAPWAEELEVRYVTSPEGLVAEIDDRIRTVTRLDEIGNPVAMEIEIDERRVTIDLLEQSRRMARGGPAVEPWELEAYAFLIGALLEEHDESFWKSIADVHTAAPAGDGCVGETIQCILGVIGWLGSLSSLTAVCGSAAATGGITAPGCLAAIIIHPTVTSSAALACANLLECLDEADPHGDCGI